MDSPLGRPISQVEAEPLHKSRPRQGDNDHSTAEQVTKIRSTVGWANNDDVLKCLDVWAFIRDYLPTKIPFEKLRERGRTLAKDLALDFANDDHYFASRDVDADEHSEDSKPFNQPNFVPESCKRFGNVPSEAKKLEVTESKYFDEYARICNEIETLDAGDINCINLLRTVASTSLDSYVDGSNTKINGCLIKKIQTASNAMNETHSEEPIVAKDLAATDIFAVMEYKMENNNDTIRDNRLKLISAISHIIHDDVRRMFMYGITVEDRFMTIWYCARDHCVRTTFDWWKHKATMISVFLCLMCATQEDLGIDPRIHLRPARKSQPTGTMVPFIYELRNGEQTKYYRTERFISGSRNLRIAGRNTRVFEVVEVDSESDDAVHEDRKRQVLKDAWMEADELTESEIQERMFRDIQRFVNSSEADHHERLSAWVQGGKIIEPLASYLRGPDPKDFRSLFLCIALESTGPPLRKKRGNYLRAPAKDTFYPKSVPVQHDGILSTSRCPSGSIVVVPRPLTPNPPRLYPAKKRTFIIFNEICKPVHALPDVGTAFHVLAGAVIALLLMHGGDWVHRDVSSGNVMAIYNHDTKQWETKLGDLEYAKKITDKTTDVDSKTGTPYFMAAEILRNSYFTDADEVNFRSVNAAIVQFLSDMDDDQQSDNTVVVVHNFYHDVESIFWVAYWLVTCRVGHQPSLEHVGPVFSRKVEPNGYRDIAFATPISVTFANHLREELRGLRKPLDKIRETLFAELFHQNRKRSWNTISHKNCHFAAYMILAFLGSPGSGKPWRSCKLQNDSTDPQDRQTQEGALKIPSNDGLRGRKRGSEWDEQDPVKKTKTESRS